MAQQRLSMASMYMETKVRLPHTGYEQTASDTGIEVCGELLNESKVYHLNRRNVAGSTKSGQENIWRGIERNWWRMERSAFGGHSGKTRRLFRSVDHRCFDSGCHSDCRFAQTNQSEETKSRMTDDQDGSDMIGFA